MGYIYLNRKLLDNPIWNCEPFSKGQAWVDLIFLANHTEAHIYVRGIKIDVKVGQVAWSEPRLAQRWRWSRTKLRRFLNVLEKEQQITQQKNNVTQIVTITNYHKYQRKETANDTAERQQKDPINKEEVIQVKKEIHKEKNSEPEIPKIEDLPKNLFDETEDLKLTIEKRRLEKIKNVYNKTTLPKITKFNDQRKKHLNARIEEHGFPKVLEVIQAAGESSFSCGGGRDGWVTNFDWIINPSNFLKIMEGQFVNRKGKSKNGNTTGTEAFADSPVSNEFSREEEDLS